MTIIERIEKTIENVSIEELKKVAIAYKDDITIEGIIIGDKVNDRLSEIMPDGEFAKFADKELW